MDAKNSSEADPTNRTVSPPANAPSLDLSKLGSQMKNLSTKSTKSHCKAPESCKPSKIPESSKQSVKNLDSSAKPSSRASESYKPPKVPESSKQFARRLDSVKPPHKSLSTIKESSSIPSSQKSSERGTSHVPSSRDISIPASKIVGTRVQTEHYQVGNMERTYLEGLQERTEYDKKSHKSYPLTQTPSSKASTIKASSFKPNTTRSIFTKPEDFSMAARQSQYQSLKPSEQEKQEYWAQSMLKKTGSCPQGFDWKRIKDGYHCDGGHHVITDELLAEGRGGVYGLDDRTHAHLPHLRYGPYYAPHDGAKEFHYGGPQPKPSHIPHSIVAEPPKDPNTSSSTVRVSNYGAYTSNVHGTGLHGSRLPTGHFSSTQRGPGR